MNVVFLVLIEEVFGEEWVGTGTEHLTEDAAYQECHKIVLEHDHPIRWAIVEVLDTSEEFAEREDEWVDDLETEAR